MRSSEPMSVASAYGPAFYQHQAQGSAQSADEIVPLLIDWIHPRTVVDVGCGVGTWLRAFQDRGVEDIFGVDGSWVDRTALRIAASRFQEVDLAAPFDIQRQFDLALSLEVAEHLPPEAAANFVTSLTTLAPVIAFSAAIPNQGGVHHLNEQWPDYWVRLFDERSYAVVDCVRPRVWDNPRVQFWYAQNVFMFVRRSHLARDTGSEAASQPALPLRVVHPRLYEQINALYEEANARADRSRDGEPRRSPDRCGLAPREWGPMTLLRAIGPPTIQPYHVWHQRRVDTCLAHLKSFLPTQRPLLALDLGHDPKMGPPLQAIGLEVIRSVSRHAAA